MLTLYDEFAGWGGSSQGAATVPGVEVVFAANHDKMAVDVHASNFPDADHYCGDVSKESKDDVTKFPRTDLFWASPACPPWSNARGKRRDFDRSTQGVLFDGEVVDEKAARARALMEEVPAYLRAMARRGEPVWAGVVENVVECRKWDQWNRWISEIRALGYQTRVIALNSMHAQPRHRSRRAPQSRDRLYVAYWHHRLGRNPDWDKWLRPTAWCSTCEQWISALQVFKKPTDDMGRYGSHGQYVYRCPSSSCRNQIVAPETRPAADAIDWSLDPGERIRDRDKPLQPATLARIEAGLSKFTGPVLTPAGGTWRAHVSPLDAPMPTRTTRETDGLVTPPMLVPLTSREGKHASPVSEPLRTQTCRQETGVVTPPFLTTLRGGGSRHSAYGLDQPLATFSADGKHHGLVTPPETHHDAAQFVLSYYSNGGLHPTGQPLKTVTTTDRHALLSTRTPRVEDCTFRMLTPSEIAAGMAFRPDYKRTGNSRQQVRGLGNAVTPPTSEIILCALTEAVTGEDIERYTNSADAAAA